MNLGFEHFDLEHGYRSFMLSISRTLPACTATQPWMRGLVLRADALHGAGVHGLEIDDFEQRVAFDFTANPCFELRRCEFVRPSAAARRVA